MAKLSQFQLKYVGLITRPGSGTKTLWGHIVGPDTSRETATQLTDGYSTNPLTVSVSVLQDVIKINKKF